MPHLQRPWGWGGSEVRRPVAVGGLGALRQLCAGTALSSADARHGPLEGDPPRAASTSRVCHTPLTRGGGSPMAQRQATRHTATRTEHSFKSVQTYVTDRQTVRTDPQEDLISQSRPPGASGVPQGVGLHKSSKRSQHFPAPLQMQFSGPVRLHQAGRLHPQEADHLEQSHPPGAD